MSIDYGNAASTAYADETNHSDYSVALAVSGHGLISDEPENFGSKNLGPNPYDFLLAALASCTAMTVRWYARQQNWPLENVEVKLSHNKVHTADCEECETPNGKVDVIEKDVVIIGDQLTNEQREKLIAVAHKCPVHKTLQSEVIIKSMGES